MYLDNVRQQYEQYPYPPRAPEDEHRRLLEVLMDRLALINFYCFQGKHTFEGARVLVAGGGTGDSTIYLAEQLREKKGEVVYVDISSASLEIARERAAVRKLDNIRFIHCSLLSLTTDEVGEFDYISCTGVLHHLDDPLAGLRALKAVLRPDGGMGVLLYAKYGRTGVYQLQDLMRLMNANESSLADKIDNTRRMLIDLPESNWFRMSEKYLSDHKRLGDSGLVDLLLHEQDVAFSIDEVYSLAAQAELNLVEFCDARARMTYRPETFVRDPVLREKIGRLDLRSRQRMGELIGGMITKHVFYLSPRTDSQAQLSDLSDVPFFFPPRLYRELGRQLAKAMRGRPNAPVSVRHETGFEVLFPASPELAAILNNIDGQRTWRQVFAAARDEQFTLHEADELALSFFQPTFEQLRQLDWMLLRSVAVGEYPDTIDMQARCKTR